MDEHIWRSVRILKVPKFQGAMWTPALDSLIPKRLYRIRVKDGATWQLDGATAACSADGYDQPPQRSGDSICTTAHFGALIAKIGGGTADKIEPNTAAKTGTIFGVGRYCVFQIPDDTKIGPVYLGANDLLSGMSKIQGQIEVEIEMAL
ncbi:MAG: hypothetical protein KF751_07640 [Nitrospira sp.]|nr:hypothetical protein [Nitrospira sp.]MBX3348965.1 hypothetical protein [Nitrospira sp.]